MRRVGQTRKRDQNEVAIVQALEAISVTVLRLSGKGCPDLLCCRQGVWLPIEVKRPRGRLTPAQRAVRLAAPFPVVESVEHALALFGVRAPRRPGYSPDRGRDAPA